MQIVEAVIASAVKLIRHHGWAQGWLSCPSGGYCVVGAIMASEADEEIRELAFDCIRKAAGTVCISTWNDAPGRSKDEIYGAMDRAIRFARELVRKREPKIAVHDKMKDGLTPRYVGPQIKRAA